MIHHLFAHIFCFKIVSFVMLTKSSLLCWRRQWKIGKRLEATISEQRVEGRSRETLWSRIFFVSFFYAFPVAYIFSPHMFQPFPCGPFPFLFFPFDFPTSFALHPSPFVLSPSSIPLSSSFVLSPVRFPLASISFFPIPFLLCPFPFQLATSAESSLKKEIRSVSS